MSQDKLSILIHRLKSKKWGMPLFYRGGSAMRKTKHLVFGIGVLISSVVSPIFSRPAPAADESITLETYYPAPYGIYNELTTTGQTLLATEGGGVGIGTTAPSQKLHIKGGNVFLETLSKAADRRGLIINDTSGSSGAVMSGGEHSTGLAFYTDWDGAAANAKMVVTPTGSVGIGATAPAGLLEVLGGEVNTSGAGRSIVLKAEDNTGAGSGGDIILQPGDANNARKRGGVGIGTEDPMANLHIQEKNWPSIFLDGDGNRGGFIGYGYMNKTLGWAVGMEDDRSFRIELFKNTEGDDWRDRWWSGWGGQSGDEGANVLTLTQYKKVGIMTSAPQYTLDVNGEARCSSGFWEASDLRWKKNIVTLPGPLEKLSRLKGVEFDWKREEFKENNFPEGRQIGIIAQELEKEFPELVSTDSSGYKAIAYDKFTAVLLEAVKELEEKIQKQGDLLRSLERELKDQKAEIENLKRKN